MTSGRATSSALAMSIAAILVLALASASRAGAFVYWANNSSGSTTIGRAANDGTGVNQSFIGGARNPCGVAVDAAHLYWANNVAGGTIGRANLDGTGVNQSFIGGANSPCGVAVDAAHLYWANINGGTIGRANVDGTGVNQNFIGGAHLPCGVAIDSAHVYWANLDGTIGRANLDGTGVNQSFIPFAIVPCGVAVDGAHVYWADAGAGDTIGRADLDGSNPNQAFVDGASGACGVAADSARLYWANGGNGTIGRANLDGTGVNQSFISGANAPCGVTVNGLPTDGHPRPKGATPIRVSLVPAFNPCVAPNRTHAPPLSSPSCAPPVQASSFLTVGTADANGAATQSSGSLSLAAVVGNPATPADEADVKLAASITDVRLKASLGDYAGQLQANARLRLIDRASGTAVNEPATVQDFVLRFTVPCQATASTSIGSTCAVNTTADAIAPGTVRERARTIWEVGQVQLFDGGPDGVASTTSGNTLFEVQGLFVP
jgi:virginiamycin B lyase